MVEKEEKPVNYKLYFWCVIFLLLGFHCGRTAKENFFYYGPSDDEAKANSNIYIESNDGQK